jgi:L-ascorbate metabolism protein UlaG (beta-lactamase superfamily)
MGINDILFWVGHACFYVKANGVNIFIDPFRVPTQIKEKADLILITHAHMDHCSKDDIQKIIKKDTVTISSQGCLEEKGYKDVITSKPGFKYDFRGIGIEAIPAYNNISDRLNYHPKANNWVGYILDVNSTRIYHAGDTDFIKEMKDLKGINAALLPMGGTYTMNVDEAIDAGKAIDATSTIPMHYKNLLGREGSVVAEEKFKHGLKNALVMKEVVEPTYSF